MAPLRSARYVSLVVLVAASYFIAGKIGLSLASINASATPVWPPTGIALASLVLGPALWPGVFIGAFLANLTTAGTIWTSLAVAAGNTLEGVIGAWLVRTFASGDRVLERPTHLFRFAFLAGGLGTMVSATVGVTSLGLAGFVPEAAIGGTWLTWWLGDLSGALVVAPLILAWARPAAFAWNRARVLEAAAMGVSLVVLGSITFSDVLRAPGAPSLPAYLAVPVVLWAAYRFTAREAATAMAVLSGIAIVNTLRGRGPYATGSTNSSLLLVQGFMTTWSMTSLVLAAATTGRRNEEAGVRTLNERLEQRVGERTERLREANESLRVEVEDRRRAQEQLGQSELRLLEAQRVAGMGSWEWDIARDRVWWSENLFTIYGLDAATFGASYGAFLECVHPEDREKVKSIVGRAVRDAQPFQLDHRIVRPDGQTRTLSAHAHVLTDDFGKPVRMIGTAQDISDRKQIEAERAQWIQEQAARREAVQANQLKDEFLAMLSHELRNPLNAIVVWSQVLRDGDLDEAATARAVDAIARNAQVQNKLITDLLDLSRLNSGRLELRKLPLDPALVVEAALDTMRPLAESKGLRLIAALDEARGIRVLADSERLQQVVWNLVSNAIHFSPDAGAIVISLKPAREWVELRVEDGGPGIHPDLLPVIFDSVRRDSTTHPGRSGGLGLGLAIVRRLAELHGGSASAANRSDGGAVLTVKLPRLAAVIEPELTRGAAPADGNGESEAALQGIRVLLVEDDFDSAEGMAKLLTRHGAEVTTAETCAGALERFQTETPHVLISDIALPDGDGYHLLAQVRMRSRERGGGVPAIALTAYAGVEHSRKATRAGFQVHFAKPFESAELIEVIARLAQ